MKKIRRYILFFLLIISTSLSAQVGDYRNDFAIGFNGGYQLNNIAFVPKVTQGMLPGVNMGFTARYTSEKYFNSICAIQVEVNYAQQGWKENIISKNDEPCIIEKTGEKAEYSRTINYVQVPLLAQLGFGREVSGCKFFLNMGPQFGYMLSEKTKTNFSVKNDPDSDLPSYMDVNPLRASYIVAQDTMAVEHKIDYGITAGIGMEISLKRFGHVMLEARYYYGLGNIYGDTKADYFARSNMNSIIFKGTYLFDIVRTRGAKRK